QSQVPHGKIVKSRLMPLTDTAGTVLLRYLRRGRPRLPYRELFLRGRAPVGVLKPTAVSDAFQKWVRHSGLDIPWQGPHCLRYSYAVHLLRRGVALKTIGDLLGSPRAPASNSAARSTTRPGWPSASPNAGRR